MPASEITEVVVHADGSREEVVPTGAAAPGEPIPTRPPVDDVPATHRDQGPLARVPLGTLVGARSGDKGGDANVGLWVRDPDHLPWLWSLVGTPAGVRRLLPETADLEVSIHPLPNLLAVNVVVHGLLGEGVASATRPDPQAKGLGEYLRARLVEVPTAWLP